MSVLLYSVCGLIVPQEDLPFNDLGICPDVVSDWHIFVLLEFCLLLLLLFRGVMFIHYCRVTTPLIFFHFCAKICCYRRTYRTPHNQK